MWMSDCSAKKRAKAGIWGETEGTEGGGNTPAQTNKYFVVQQKRTRHTAPQHHRSTVLHVVAVQHQYAHLAQRVRKGRGGGATARGVRGLEKASRNRRTEALKPRQSTIGAPRWAKIRTMPFIWQATAATRVQEERQGARATANQNSVLNKFNVRQRSKGTAYKRLVEGKKYA